MVYKRRIFATKEQLLKWYVEEKRSYRFIMKQLNCNSARSIKKLLVDNGIEIRIGSEAVKTQWINNENRRLATSNKAKESFKNFWGTQSKRPEVRKKISESKIGSKNPMWGKFAEQNPAYLGGKRNWRFKRKISKSRRKQIFEALGNKCIKCKSKEKLTIHHDPPWRIVQSHDLKFLSLLCKKCHFHGPVHLR